MTSCVLIKPSGNSCHLGSAQKCYTELSSALCKVFWGISLPNNDPRLWNFSGQSSCFHPYFYIDALLSCRDKCCSRCRSVLCISSDEDQSLTDLLRYPVAPGHKGLFKRLIWNSSSTEEEFGHFLLCFLCEHCWLHLLNNTLQVGSWCKRYFTTCLSSLLSASILWKGIAPCPAGRLLQRTSGAPLASSAGCAPCPKPSVHVQHRVQLSIKQTDKSNIAGVSPHSQHLKPTEPVQ